MKAGRVEDSWRLVEERKNRWGAGRIVMKKKHLTVHI